MVERGDEPGVVEQGHEVCMRLGPGASSTEIQSALQDLVGYSDDSALTLSVGAAIHFRPPSRATAAG
jgi:hypothetical protein